MKIPDSEGRSPHERRLERREKIRDAVTSGKTDGLVNLAMGAMAYRNKEIPGRGKTYGEEVDRIRNETRAEIDRELGPEQRDTFENTRIDSLVGGGGGNSVVMTTHWEAGDSPEGVAIVGGSVEVEAVTEEDGGE